MKGKILLFSQSCQRSDADSGLVSWLRDLLCGAVGMVSYQNTAEDVFPPQAPRWPLLSTMISDQR